MLVHIASVWLRTSLHVTAAPPRVGTLPRASPLLPSIPEHRQGFQARQESEGCQRLHTLDRAHTIVAHRRAPQVGVRERDAWIWPHDCAHSALWADFLDPSPWLQGPARDALAV
jgi:hypothetical protein